MRLLNAGRANEAMNIAANTPRVMSGMACETRLSEAMPQRVSTSAARYISTMSLCCDRACPSSPAQWVRAKAGKAKVRMAAGMASAGLYHHSSEARGM